MPSMIFHSAGAECGHAERIKTARSPLQLVILRKKYFFAVQEMGSKILNKASHLKCREKKYHLAFCMNFGCQFSLLPSEMVIFDFARYSRRRQLIFLIPLDLVVISCWQRASQLEANAKNSFLARNCDANEKWKTTSNWQESLANCRCDTFRMLGHFSFEELKWTWAKGDSIIPTTHDALTDCEHFIHKGQHKRTHSRLVAAKSNRNGE